MRSPGLLVTMLLTGCSLYFADDAPPDGPVPVPRARCAPAPVTRASTVAPQLRAWIIEAEGSGCSLAQRTSAGAVNGFPGPLDTFPAPGTVACDADGCWTRLPAFARAWSEHPAPAAFTYRQEPLGEPWIGMVRAERNDITGELRATLTAMTYGSSALRRFDRRWDRAGHLLGERESWSGMPWFAIDNTWDGDRLVASRYLDTVNGTGETTSRWSYDGARLTAAIARHADSGAESDARLWYDDAGHLTELVRTLGEVPWARQTWSYAGDAVIGATTELHPQVDADARLVAGADDLTPMTSAGAQGEWDAAAGLVATAAGCAQLPHGLQYGYPEADGAYALGWAVGDRPGGIDGDYGFGNVYDTGLDRWFGHDRVEAYTFRQPWSEATVRSAQTFDRAGRMVVEHVATDDGTLAAARSRAFAGATLVSDQRTLHRDGATLVSVLRFEHDGGGRLTARTYQLDGALAARHRWRYDGDAVVGHDIETAGLRFGEPGFALTIPDLASLAPLAAPIVHERLGAGGDERWLRDGRLVSSRGLDEHGRVVWRQLDDDDRESFAYDDDGGLRSYAHGGMTLAYQHDAAGRLIARTWSYGEAGGDRDQFSYTCR